jgi:carbamoyl-phosphate synthase small subunit
MPNRPKKYDDHAVLTPLQQAINQLGGQAELAKRLSDQSGRVVTRQIVNNWVARQSLPSWAVRPLHDLTGISYEALLGATVDDASAAAAQDGAQALLPVLRPALLALADGTVFYGHAFGATGTCVGEVVFNTAMTGYQEILTDPSYCRQIVTLTYPHIGNVGINSEDVESGSNRVFAAGLVIRDLSVVVSNYRSEQTLDGYLKAEKVCGISGIDTRKLTRILRDGGAQSGAIVTGEIGQPLDSQAALAAARGFAGLNGLDLAKVVSTPQSYSWTQTEWSLTDGLKSDRPSDRQTGGYGDQGMGSVQAKYKVVAYDFGVKRNILRMLASRGCALTVVPAQTPAHEVLALNPDGVFLSNGPGDPGPCDSAIDAARTFIEQGLPTFGICLGHQIMGLAAGATTSKMKFGHHGANHPVKDLDTGKVVITSQNHGFAVDAATLPPTVRATHVSLFDGSLQGLAWKDKPAFCFQGHPEASPGPQDIGYLFDKFIALMAHQATA